MAGDKSLVDELADWIKRLNFTDDCEPWRSADVKVLYKFLLLLGKSCSEVDDTKKITALLHLAESSQGIPNCVTETDLSTQPKVSLLTYLAFTHRILGDDFMPPQFSENPDIESVDLDTEFANNCPKCDLTPTFLDRVIVDNRVWHRKCFLCDRCGAQLRKGTYRHVDTKRAKYECVEHEHDCALKEIVEEEKAETMCKTLEEVKITTEKDEIQKQDENDENQKRETKSIETTEKEQTESSETVKPEVKPDVETVPDRPPSTNPFEDDEDEILEIQPVEKECEKPATESPSEEQPPKLAENIIAPETIERPPSTNPFEDDEEEAAKDSQSCDSSQNVEDKPKESETKTEKPPEILVQESPGLLEAPIPPPRRKRRSAQSSRASSVETSTRKKTPPKVKPKPPPKPDLFEQYPDYLNPFGSDEESESSDYDESLNPFACDDEDDTSSVSTREQSDTDSVQLRQTPSRPVPAPRLSLQPQTNTDTSTKRLSLHSPKSRPKRPAPAPPPPPPPESEKPKIKPPVPPKPSRQALQRRKKRPAPPPPMPTRRKVVMDITPVSSLDEVRVQLQNIDNEQHELEARATKTQTELVDSIENEPEVWDKRLIVDDWLRLIEQKCDLVRKESDFVHIWLELHLDSFHSDIEYQLRCIIEKPESDKTEKDSHREAKLLQLLLDVIEQKNRLVEKQQPLAVVSVEQLSEVHNRNQQKAKKKKLKNKIKKLRRKLDGSGKDKEAKDNLNGKTNAV